MAARRRARFLQYMSRPRLVLIFEIDNIVVGFVTFAAMYYLCVTIGLMIIFTFLISFISTYFAIVKYAKIKENTAQGFLYHFFYVNDIYSIKEDPKKYPEVSKKDIGQIIPDGNAKEFID
jgi:hypothetical protein